MYLLQSAAVFGPNCIYFFASQKAGASKNKPQSDGVIKRNTLILSQLYWMWQLASTFCIVNRILYVMDDEDMGGYAYVTNTQTARF